MVVSDSDKDAFKNLLSGLSNLENKKTVLNEGKITKKPSKISSKVSKGIGVNVDPLIKNILSNLGDLENDK